MFLDTSVFRLVSGYKYIILHCRKLRVVKRLL